MYVSRGSDEGICLGTQSSLTCLDLKLSGFVSGRRDEFGRDIEQAERQALIVHGIIVC